ncbi:MAG: hypothetical protein Q8P31_06865 [Bacillota bacterium]|nr:hypothetical protein [Bacillota bacterium]
MVETAMANGTRALYLYGSVCRGDYIAGWSDIDHLYCDFLDFLWRETFAACYGVSRRISEAYR